LPKVNIKNKTGSYGGNLHVENLYAKDKSEENKIFELYAERLNEKDKLIEKLYNIIDKLNS
jgi:hypothetical protein